MKKLLVVSRKSLVVSAVCLMAAVAVAAPRPERLRMPSAPLTNSFEIAGVKFPPRYTEEQFRMRKVAFEALHQELKRIEAIFRMPRNKTRKVV